ncbi:beta-N-acetylhexosaminidase [Geitlerinema splendidum]|nr:beta-N-acetylhexosaminidase [Geitlerinema splendidum]
MILSTLAFVSAAIPTQSHDEVAIIPIPAKIVRQSGEFMLKPTTVIVASQGAESTARYLQNCLEPATGFHLKIASEGESAISLELSKQFVSLGEEGYSIVVTPSKVRIGSSKPQGLFYGVQTLRQLFPTQIFRSGKVDGIDWTIPCVTVDDSPRFKWRGLMLDVARHFQHKQEVMTFIDAAATHKFNTLHMHLTDDQGWRVEIKKYPRLTEVGAWRSETVIGKNTGEYDGKPHGGFYTQEDLREIVAYAAARHITVVPEIDMPGHMMAAVAAYPELGDGKPAEIMKIWGVSSRVLNTRPETVQFCKDVLDEIMDIFPSKFIHIGGDECPKDQWKADPEEQARMKERGLKDEHELQSWFIRQMDSYLVSKGRRLIGWDEILEGGLAENAAVMSWRGTSGGLQAAKEGHDVVMSPTSHMYLDYYQSRSPDEPLAIGGFLPLQQVYSFEPIPKDLETGKHHHILGVQGNLWSEYMKDYKHVQYMAFPRACAVAEVGWSRADRKNLDQFINRLETHVKRLTAMDIRYRALTPPDLPAAQWKSGQLREEFQTVEWDLSEAIKQNGNYRIRFAYTSGDHRLDIAWAELIINGVSAGKDEHAGQTGGETKNNVYRFNNIKVPPGAKVMLQASVRTDGGTDSNGDIIVERA